MNNLILSIRTDKPQAELCIYDGQKLVDQIKWQAHRELSTTIHLKIEEILTLQGASLQSVTGVVIYEGPGSFTGLRIGFSVANALAQGLNIPVVAAGAEDWIKDSINKIKSAQPGQYVAPNYGQQAKTTKPKK